MCRRPDHELVMSLPSTPCQCHQPTDHLITSWKLFVLMKQQLWFPTHGIPKTHLPASQTVRHDQQNRLQVMKGRCWGCIHIPRLPSSVVLRHPSLLFVSAIRKDQLRLIVLPQRLVQRQRRQLSLQFLDHGCLCPCLIEM